MTNALFDSSSLDDGRFLRFFLITETAILAWRCIRRVQVRLQRKYLQLRALCALRSSIISTRQALRAPIPS
ncbi:MAG: hypothetical protein B6D38_04930 [Anaerolineae bacterium UTCFX1]|nr:MAG: hypothetical protein B6D38_04930 [Anaerolineae bacterium UTCFX1]